MSTDEILDFGREHILSARDDHLVVATADVEQAVGVEVSDVTG